MDKEKIIEIIAEKLNVKESLVTPEANFMRNLGADSLDLIELMIAFEDAFDIDIHDEDVQHIRTVQETLDYLEKAGV
jgi:acyl carrier protein